MRKKRTMEDENHETQSVESEGGGKKNTNSNKRKRKEQHTNTRFKLCYSFLNCDNSQILSGSRRLKLHEIQVKKLWIEINWEKWRGKQQSRRVNNSKVCIFSYFWCLSEGKFRFFLRNVKKIHFIKMNKTEVEEVGRKRERGETLSGEFP